MYLLDTVIFSELRKRRRNPGVVAWLQSVVAEDLFVSAITIGEIELGIEKQRQSNPDFASDLTRWLETTLRVYADRVLALDTRIARRWGRLAVKIGNRGLDLAIAATALEHGLCVATRNVTDFLPTGVQVLNPYTDIERRSHD